MAKEKQKRDVITQDLQSNVSYGSVLGSCVSYRGESVSDTLLIPPIVSSVSSYLIRQANRVLLRLEHLRHFHDWRRVP